MDFEKGKLVKVPFEKLYAPGVMVNAAGRNSMIAGLCVLHVFQYFVHGI